MKNFILVSLFAVFIAVISACDNGFDTKALNLPQTGGGTGDGTSPTPTPTPDPTVPDGTPCGEAMLSWTNPTQYTDGSPITTSEPLIRNIVYVGFSSTQFANQYNVSNPPANGSYRVTGLEKGRTYYFAVKAVSYAGIESDYSAIVSKTISTCPSPLSGNKAEAFEIDIQALSKSGLQAIEVQQEDPAVEGAEGEAPSAPQILIEEPVRSDASAIKEVAPEAAKEAIGEEVLPAGSPALN